MSLSFVTAKLEGQSLEEQNRSAKRNHRETRQLERTGEDSCAEEEDLSRTQSNNQTDHTNTKSRSSIVSNLRSSSTAAAGKATTFGGRRKCTPPQQARPPVVVRESLNSRAELQRARPPPREMQRSSETMAAATDGGFDDGDAHSSEEELEDIINKKKVYVSEPATGQRKSSSGGSGVCGGGGVGAAGATGGRTSAVEKRKWSEVDKTSASSRTGSGSSGDEEVSGYMGPVGDSVTPVQFCTSPPLNVYKPRRSQSPPPKLFHLAANGQTNTNNSNSFRAQRPSGAFRPRVVTGSGGVVVSMDGLAEEDEDQEADGDTRMHDRDRASPQKRHRTTPRPHTIQRPCLDFEKMQQIKTKVVTSWRQGTELSLFCW